jgi:hypothetical protein
MIPTPLPADVFDFYDPRIPTYRPIPDFNYPDYYYPEDAKTLMLRWQDNRSEKWSKIKPISLGSQGNTSLTRHLRPMGTYRSRQFELVVSDPVVVYVTQLEDDNGVIE